MSSAFARAFVPAVIVGVGISIASCYSPTQFTVEVTTDYGCPKAPGSMSITAGARGRVEGANPSAVSAGCDNGNYGTLVIVPSGARDDDVLVKVVASIGKPVEQCQPPYGKGCIVARRSLRFLKHRSLRLPIVMRTSCDGIPCGELDTCVNGQCKPALIDPERCTGDGCTEEELFNDVPPVEGGVIDGPPSDAGPDADAEPEVDAEADADDGIAPPRLVAPLSTSTVSSTKPTLKWALAKNTDGVVIEVCADRSCSNRLFTITPPKNATQLVLQTALTPKVPRFWRARSVVGSQVGMAYSHTWELMVAPTPADGGTMVSTSYGTRLDVDGDGIPELAIGSPFDGTGRVHLHRPGNVTTVMNPDLEPGFGAAVASAGDVNGDGYGDLIVGTNIVNAQSPRVLVFHGGPNGLKTTVAQRLIGAAGSGFGSAIAGAGDLNGDGYADIVVGAPFDDAGYGRAYVYFGGPSGIMSAATTLTAMPEKAGTEFGRAVGGAADFDGDGLADLVVGAPMSGSPALGTAHLFKGALIGPPFHKASISANPGGMMNNSTSFGASVAVGDTNGDGYSDLLVGVPGASSGTAQNAGGFALFIGGAAGLATTASLAVTVEDISNARYGAAVAIGDADSDGFADMFIGAPNAERFAMYRGPDGVKVGNPTTSPGVPGLLFGTSIAAIGDYTGNGTFDLVVGAPDGGAASAYRYSFTPAGGIFPTPIAGGISGFGASVARRTRPARAGRLR